MVINNPLKISSSNSIKERKNKYYNDTNYYDDKLDNDIEIHNLLYRDNISKIGMKPPSGVLFYMDIICK